MSIDERIHEALHNQLVSYFDYSELPESWDDWLREGLERDAARSAAQIRQTLGAALVPELASLLRAASLERRGELVREIESWTRFAWGRRDHTWAALQQLMLALARHLTNDPAA